MIRVAGRGGGEEVRSGAIEEANAVEGILVDGDEVVTGSAGEFADDEGVDTGDGVHGRAHALDGVGAGTRDVEDLIIGLAGVAIKQAQSQIAGLADGGGVERGVGVSGIRDQGARMLPMHTGGAAMAHMHGEVAAAGASPEVVAGSGGALQEVHAVVLARAELASQLLSGGDVEIARRAVDEYREAHVETGAFLVQVIAFGGRHVSAVWREAEGKAVEVVAGVNPVLFVTVKADIGIAVRARRKDPAVLHDQVLEAGLIVGIKSGAGIEFVGAEVVGIHDA